MALRDRVAALEAVLVAHKGALRRMGEGLDEAWRRAETLGEALRLLAARQQDCARCGKVALDRRVESVVDGRCLAGLPADPAPSGTGLP
ncbi:MAG: hypothetical protein JNK11_12710 [Alphaproteobacteria bacterium]|nr:hypothetical protein [Alphaproteobacteria bacterium]